MKIKKRENKSTMLFCRLEKSVREKFKNMAVFYELSESQLLREVIKRALISYNHKKKEVE